MSEYPRYPDGGQGWNPQPGAQIPPNHGYGAHPVYTPPPDNNIVWSIVATVLCCMPLGIVSLIQASRVNSLWGQGRFDEARHAAQSAKNWAIWSMALMVLWVIGLALFFLFGIVLSAENR